MFVKTLREEGVNGQDVSRLDGVTVGFAARPFLDPCREPTPEVLRGELGSNLFLTA